MTIEERNLIILYLHREKNWTANKCKLEFNLAAGTIRNYCYKLDNEDNRRLGEKLYLQYYEPKEYTRTIKEVEEDNSKELYSAYICEMYDEEGNFLFGKIGYSNNYARRSKEHLHNKKYNCSKIETKKVFMFEDEEVALSFENMLRKYYKEKYQDSFIRRDRFSEHLGSRKEIEEFEKKKRQLELVFE